MKFWLRTGFPIFLFLYLLGISLPGRAAPQANDNSAPATPDAPAAITRVRILLNNDAPALEITSDHPISPQITKLDGPPRLMVDLPNAQMSVESKEIPVQSERLSLVRLDQYQKTPPTVRVVLSLLKPSDYSANSVANVLTIRLQPVAGTATEEANITRPPAIPQGIEPPPGISGALLFAGRSVAPGSSVSAGSDTAVLRLGRGGEVRVCPGTTVSVTTSANGNQMMLGMSTGGLETHYALNGASDSILTPDFRILLSGPGEFHYAFTADSRGNTCVRALPGNTASATVEELMGDGIYHVMPSEQIVFHSGRLTEVDTTVPPTCGCPAPPEPVKLASAEPPPAITDQNLRQALRRPEPAAQAPLAAPPTQAAPASQPSPAQVAVAGPEASGLSTAKNNDVHVQVEAPFVFRANQPQPPDVQPPTKPIPSPPTTDNARIPLAYSKPPEALQTAVQAPPAKPKKEEKTHKGFLGKIKGFFSSMFK